MMVQPNSRALLVAVARSHHHLAAGLVFYLAGVLFLVQSFIFLIKLIRLV